MNYIVTKKVKFYSPVHYKIEEEVIAWEAVQKIYQRRQKEITLMPSWVFCPICRITWENMQEKTIISWDILKWWFLSIWEEQQITINERTIKTPEWLVPYNWEVTHIIEFEWDFVKSI